jgi:hypothetical protein
LLSDECGETKFLTGDPLERNVNSQVFDNCIKPDAPYVALCYELIAFLVARYRIDRVIRRLKEKDSSDRGFVNPSRAKVKIIRDNKVSELFYVQYNE